MLEYLGLILSLIIWVAIGFMLLTWQGTYAMSISQHAASAKGAYNLLFVTLIVGELLFYYWLLTWFAPHLELPGSFSYVLSLTVLLQIIAGVIPDSTGWKHRTHQSAAYFMAVLYIPLTYLIVTSSVVSTLATIT